MKKLLVILLTLFASSLWAQNAEYSSNQTIRIQDTEMAHLPSVTDVLNMLPGVRVDNDVVMVIGRGTPAVYIDNRKVADFSELKHIRADRVKEVMIMRHPGAEYNKSADAVIVIRLKPDEAEGLQVDNTLRFDLTHKLSTNNELLLKWRHKALMLGTFVGWNEERHLTDKTSFTNTYKDNQLIKEEQHQQHPDVRKQWLTLRLMAAYDFNNDSKLTFNYSMIDKERDHTYVPEELQVGNSPDKRHDFALEYSGHAGMWDYAIGNNSFIDHADQVTDKPTVVKYYLRKEYDLRTYAKASRKVWKGALTAGVEHELDHMNVKMHEDDDADDPDMKKYYKTHAIIPDNIIGVFATLSQTFGRWNVEGGLRYEHRHAVYRPCADDGLLMFIDDFTPLFDIKLPAKYYLIPALMNDRKLSYDDDDLYPSLKVSTRVGQSEVALRHSEHRVHPYLGITRLRIKELDFMEEKILWPERASTTSLDWKYKWVGVTASYSYYDQPICSTLSASTQYNAPDYDAVDLDITLAPKVGVWTPVLMAHLHKQWFDMPLASGKDRLKKPYASLSFNNTVVLPYGWILRANSQWHSRGAERNNYYFSSDIKLDLSLQKTLPRQGLTIMLSAVNLLRTNYEDKGCYVQAFNGVSEGIRERQPRLVQLSIRYKL